MRVRFIVDRRVGRKTEKFVTLYGHGMKPTRVS